METAREYQKDLYMCFIDYSKAFDCVDHDKLWTILNEMGVPQHLVALVKEPVHQPKRKQQSEQSLA